MQQPKIENKELNLDPQLIEAPQLIKEDKPSRENMRAARYENPGAKRPKVIKSNNPWAYLWKGAFPNLSHQYIVNDVYKAEQMLGSYKFRKNTDFVMPKTMAGFVVLTTIKKSKYPSIWNRTG